MTEIEFTCAVSTVSFKATYAAANIRPFSICTQGVGITSVSKGAVALIEIYETVTEMVWQLNRGYGDVHMFYSKKPKSVTAFNLFTFFRADLIQSEASWKLFSTSDWLMP